MISQQRIPVTSTSDTFVLLLPEPLRGPRQPFFDNADFTGCETDGRVNTQVYGDGREAFFTPLTRAFIQGCTVYRGELYGATNVNQTPNFLQKYNPINDSFEYIPVSSLTASMRSLAVYDGQLAVTASNRVEFFNGSTMFSTNFLSSTTFCPIVYNQKLYVTTTGFLTTGSNAATRPQLYEYQNNSNFSLVSQMQAYTTGTVGVSNTSCNAIVYGGDLYFYNQDSASSGNITRLQQTTYNPTSLSNTQYFGTGLFNGHMKIGRNDIRIWRWADGQQITDGRLTSFTANGGAMVAYKGKFHVLKQGSTSNNVDFTEGDYAGASGNSLYTRLTTSFFNLTGSFGNMIVHDGKLFFNVNQSAYMHEYGNGTTLDAPISSSAVLLMFRKNQTNAELWMNGIPIQSKVLSFTTSNQPSRFSYIGGAAGTLTAAYNDPGMDHLQGCIYSYAQYTSNLSEGDRQRAEGFLMWQYGFQNTLPATHPFRNSPPT
jgi:hypothetical protein